MKFSYLIDTYWIIHYLNGNRNIVSKLRSLENEGLTVSVISIAELYEGIYYSTNPDGNKRAVDDLLSGVSILAVEDEICRLFGKERGRLRQAKKMIGDFDLLIASSCLCYNLTLFTNNRRHYEMVGGLKILSVS